MIYGANGYCGRRLARFARDHGFSPLLAGRSKTALEALAGELQLPWRTFDLADRHATTAALAGMKLVMNCAGPFAATSRPMILACLEARAHYLDINGEIEVFIEAEHQGAAARKAGIVVCPGVGFDVVPTDCVAAVLKEALPEATHLALGFAAPSTMSPGSAKTITETLKFGCRVRENGALLAIPFGSDRRRIDFAEGEALGVAISWGDVACAYFTTGIPNIRFYLRMSAAVASISKATNALMPLLRMKPVERALGRLAHRLNHGPSEQEFSHAVSFIWGEARAPGGKTVAARLTTSSPYRLTLDAQMMALRHVLEERPVGDFYTPSRLLGRRAVERLPGSGKIRLSPNGSV
jgi:short subunit dehydrogenase-like uncharacterized protein